MSVVNCFRSLYLWVNLQRKGECRWHWNCCELLSFFVPLGEFTACHRLCNVPVCCELLSFFVPLGEFTAASAAKAVEWRLWIAFVLCTFGWIYSQVSDLRDFVVVVNCFRSLYLWVNLQHGCLESYQCNSCELLSFFVPLGEFTANCRSSKTASSLWIAFVLCTFGWIYSNLCSLLTKS